MVVLQGVVLRLQVLVLLLEFEVLLGFAEELLLQVVALEDLVLQDLLEVLLLQCTVVSGSVALVTLCSLTQYVAVPLVLELLLSIV